MSEKWEEEQDSLITELGQTLTSHLDELSRAIAEANSAAEQEARTRLVTADERMRRTRSQFRRAAKIAMGHIAE